MTSYNDINSRSHEILEGNPPVVTEEPQLLWPQNEDLGSPSERERPMSAGLSSPCTPQATGLTGPFTFISDKGIDK